ncbi:MAG: diguanylate cyclase [Actinobacteria bacterium]|nr:diguanylate cyclase [Actinomycetota bacterium]
MGITTETDHGLKTDATLAELSHAAPHDERDLACIVCGLWWAIEMVTLLAGTLLMPDLIESGAAYWQFGGALYGVLIATSLVTWVRRLPERTCYRVLDFAVMLAIATSVVLMVAAPAGVPALTLNMLSAVMFAAYFLGGRMTFVTTVVVTLTTILPLLLNVDASSAEHMTSRLTVWIPVVWMIALAIHLQNRERHAAVEMAESQATADRLTGLDNLRALREHADSALAEARASGRLTGLLLIDLDDLKEINASRGHRAGDEVLVAVAEALKAAASGNHHVARISGDVFAVLVENAVAADMEPLAARFRAAVHAARNRVGPSGMRLDCGVGTAIAPEDGHALEDLMTVADRMLYDLKRRRRDLGEEPVTGRLPADFLRKTSIPLVTPAYDHPATIDPEQPIMFGRPLHAFTAAAGWLMAIVLMLMSMAMPDADRSHISVALPVTLLALIPASLVFFFPPRLRSMRHFVNDMLTLVMIAVVSYLTGGVESPALALVFAFMIHEGWFMSPRQLIPRAIAMVLVIVAPLAYEDIGEGANALSQIATIYMAVNVALWQTLAMGLSRTYILRAQEVALRLAKLDPLTGLANRETFEADLERQLEDKPFSNEDSLAIVMIDLEGFKRINSLRGHGAGDRLLCEIADALRVTMRADDVLARIGGDEFAALVPSASEHEARALAERLVSAIDDCVAISPDASASRITTCAGFSLFPTHGRTADELMSAADLALLTVKSGGRGSRVSRLVVGL